MKAHMPMAICLQLVFSAWMAFSFVQIYKEGGIQNGLLFGFFLGVLVGLINASWYLWLPVPFTFMEKWLATGFGECLGCGLILGFVYRKDRGKQDVLGRKGQTDGNGRSKKS